MANGGKLLLCSVAALLLTGWLAQAQDANQPLLVVGSDTTTAGEFLYSYRKNYEARIGGDSLSLRAFLESYVVYRLKVADGERMQLDTMRQYREEYMRYRNSQLAALILDSATVEEGYRAAYARMQREVDASHILVAVTPERDDKAALDKAQELRKKLMAGEDFASLARRESDDPTAKQNGGRLGYFSAFTMVAPFEVAAFSTAVGGVSEPVRSQFGYHLIKVHAARPSRGRMQVGHVLVRMPGGVTLAQRDSVKATIDRAYAEAKAGTPFDTIMRRYSPSLYASSAGGRYPWVSAGTAPAWFYEKVFSLEHDGDVSAPFESPLGWHMVKRIAHETIPPYKDAREELRTLMRRSGQSVDDDAAFVKAARSLVGAQVRDSVVVAFEQWLAGSTPEESLPRSLAAQSLGEVNGQQLMVEEFNHWAIAQGIDFRGAQRGGVRQLLEQYVDLLSVERASQRVAASDKRYAYLIQEFHDGLLLFDVSDRKVWAADLTTEEALQAYYNAHRKELLFDTCYTVEEYSASDSKFLEAIAKKFRGEAKLRLSNRIMKKQGVVRREMRLGSDHPLMYGYEANGEAQARRVGRTESWRKKCLGPVSRNGGSKLYRVAEVATSVPMSYEESKPKIRMRLQDDRERAWVEGLRKEFHVEVKEDALQWVEKQLER